jgi:hypothetical protein
LYPIRDATEIRTPILDAVRQSDGSIELNERLATAGHPLPSPGKAWFGAGGMLPWVNF